MSVKRHRDVDYKDTDGCGKARYCDNIACMGIKCNDYFETTQHKKWREIQERRNNFIALGRD